MSRTEHQVIVGASAAGVAAALALRSNGFDGSVTLVESGPHLPYERPPLSKSFFLDRAALLPIVPEETYAAQALDLRLSTSVRAVEPSRRRVLLDDGEHLPADGVLLATGALARRLDVPGSDLPGVLTLRDAQDAARITERLAGGGPLVVVGGGFIGLEAAAVAREQGVEVTVVELMAAPLLGPLGAQAAALLARLHRDHGVRLLTDVAVTGFAGRASLEGVLLADGRRVEAAVAIVGAGVVVNDELARAAGVTTRQGVVVDRYGRTDVAGIWAAGDVASQPHPHLAGPGRIEHWTSAQLHGTAVGAGMAGQLTAHEDVPYFWSEQYGLHLQMYGRSQPGDDVVLRAGATPESFLAFWLRGGRLVAAAALAAPKPLRAVKPLVARHLPVSAASLADPTVDLRVLARELAARHPAEVQSPV